MQIQKDILYVNLLNLKNFDLIGIDSSGTNAFHVKKELSNPFEILSATKSFKKSLRYHSKDEVSKIENDTLKYNFLELE